MKKILFALALSVFLTMSAYCVTSDEIYSAKNVIEAQNKIDEIGFNILNSNGIEVRTVFDFDIKRTKNAYSRYRDRQIVVYRGLFDRLKSDDEIAAILAHEISHSVESYNGILRGYFTAFTHSFAPRKYEYKADKKAVDYMVHAGYNPVAFIVVMSKTFPQERYEWCSSHPLTTRRMMQVYEYIYKKYPEYLANNVYKNNLYYQNFLLTSKVNRSNFKAKVESNSKSSIKYY